MKVSILNCVGLQSLEYTFIVIRERQQGSIVSVECNALIYVFQLIYFTLLTILNRMLYLLCIETKNCVFLMVVECLVVDSPVILQARFCDIAYISL